MANTTSLRERAMGNGLKVSFLIKQTKQGDEEIHRLIPWDVPATDIQVFDPYQEWLTCVISGLKTGGRDLREAEYINTIISVNEQPVFWTSAEHLFARLNISVEKRLKREKNLKNILTKAGLEYDKKPSEDISTSFSASTGRSRFHS